MAKQTVFSVGATGETGGAVLQALIEDGSFDITRFIRKSLANKPSVQALKDRGLKLERCKYLDNVTVKAPCVQALYLGPR